MAFKYPMFFLCCKIVNFIVIAESIDGHIKFYLGFSYSEAMCCGNVDCVWLRNSRNFLKSCCGRFSSQLISFNFSIFPKLHIFTVLVQDLTANKSLRREHNKRERHDGRLINLNSEVISDEQIGPGTPILQNS